MLPTAVAQQGTILVLCLLHHAGATGAPATRLRVEYLQDPLTIDEAVPRFSWALPGLGGDRRGVSQASWRLRVRSQPPSNGQASGEILVWDSGVVSGNQTLNVPYGHPSEALGEDATPAVPLASDTDYVWDITWTGTDGIVGPTATAMFSTAILDAAGDGRVSPDWHGAEWISSPANGSLNTYRAVFTTGPARIVRARLYIAGLGYAKTWLNGQLTDGHELGQFVTFQKRVLYDCVDVTELLSARDDDQVGPVDDVPGRDGDLHHVYSTSPATSPQMPMPNRTHSLGVMLGRGWFAERHVDAGPRQFLALLSLVDATGARTYHATKVHPGDVGAPGAPAELPLLFNATRGPVVFEEPDPGECYDGRIAAAISGWSRPDYRPDAAVWVAASAPTLSPADMGSTLRAHRVPITTYSNHSPVAITQPGPNGAYVADFGQNMAGQVTLRVKDCPAGTNISLQHTEILYPNGQAHNSFCERPK